MRRIVFFAIALAVILFSLGIGISAQENVTYYYVNSETGVDNIECGSVDAPVKTFTYALNLANRNRVEGELVVVFQNSYTFVKTVNEVAHPDYSVKLTAKDETTDYRESGAEIIFLQNLRYMLNGTTSFENIDITYTGTLNFTAQYNPITFGEGITMTRTDSDLSGIYVVGGFQAPTDQIDTSMDTHITIKSGTFRHVCGGTRDKADGVSGSMYEICTFTGTHYIDIYGGYIENLYGGSLKTHYSTSAVINMYDGEILNFNVAGDLSRRLNGDATVTLKGGKVGTLNVNNIIGTAIVNLAGTKVEKATVWCYNDEVKKLVVAANKPKVLNYDANYYTSAEIEALGAEFDKLENTAVIYVSQNGSGMGDDEKHPTNFKNGFSRAADSGSKIVVLGTITLDNFVEPEHKEKVTVTGGTLVIKGTYIANGDTEFASCILKGETVEEKLDGDVEITVPNYPTISSPKNTVTVAKDVKTSNDGITINGNTAKLYGGTFDDVFSYNVIVDGATVNKVNVGSIVGFSRPISYNIELISGTIKEIITENGKDANLTINMSGGVIEQFYVYESLASYDITLLGGKIKECTVIGREFDGTLTIDEKNFDKSSVSKLLDKFTVSTDRVLFVKGGGTGNGSSVNNALGSIHDAYKALAESGGTVVVCGEYTMTSAIIDLPHTGKITVTSVHDGVDYRKSGACINFAYNFYCGGDTEFNNIVLNSATNYPSIYANGFNLVLGEGIESGKVSGSAQYLSVMGGSRSPYTDDESSVTINSGHWQRVRGGTTVDGSKNYTAKLTINGGEFHERITLGSSNSHDGDLIAEMNGGMFYQGIAAATLSANGVYNGTVTLTLNGGTFYHKIAANPLNTGTFNGKFNVIINGGEFAHLVEMSGTENLAGDGESTIVSNVDLSQKESGTYTFTSPIRLDGADPWLFYHDGYYYYTSTTGSSSVSLVRATNIGDLIHYGGTKIYTPEAGKPWSNSTWSPTLLHYTDEEVGEGNGGWYFYFGGAGADNTTNEAKHRMYVLKCIDGDNILGRWANPVTGVLNDPLAVTAPDIEGFDEKWAAGQGDIRIDGKVYVLYVTDELSGTPDHYQTINIIPMTNPWTFKGQSSVICYPTEKWEMGGHKTNSVTGETTPKTVECASPLYADDGTVFITYSGSNYTSKEYCVAYLKFLGGDPLDIDNWEKCKTPIISQSEFVSGTGSACNLIDTAGQGWIVYNAYEGKDTSGARHAMIEPYTASKDGIVVGDGSGKAAIGGTSYTAELNPMPLIDKINGFGSVDYEKSKFEVKRAYDGRFTDVTDAHWFAPYVKNAYELSLANGTSQTKFS
ncbi:MAG: hypothetical protein E7598_04540, partial [Ruminococcaceae bacterium]|nr:hypothetical protein [Oscillospiraceae bacterium]